MKFVKIFALTMACLVTATSASPLRLLAGVLRGAGNLLEHVADTFAGRHQHYEPHDHFWKIQQPSRYPTQHPEWEKPSRYQTHSSEWEVPPKQSMQYPEWDGDDDDAEERR